MDNEKNGLVTITDDDGKEIQLEAYDIVEYDGKSYCVLMPIDDEEEDGTCYIYRIEGDPDDPTVDLAPVEDEEELNAAFEKFLEKNSESGCTGDCSGCAGCSDGDDDK